LGKFHVLSFSVFILSHKFTQIDCEFVCAVLQMHIYFIKPSSIHDPIGKFVRCAVVLKKTAPLTITNLILDSQRAKLIDFLFGPYRAVTHKALMLSYQR